MNLARRSSRLTCWMTSGLRYFSCDPTMFLGSEGPRRQLDVGLEGPLWGTVQAAIARHPDDGEPKPIRRRTRNVIIAAGATNPSIDVGRKARRRHQHAG